MEMFGNNRDLELQRCFLPKRGFGLGNFCFHSEGIFDIRGARCDGCKDEGKSCSFPAHNNVPVCKSSFHKVANPIFSQEHFRQAPLRSASLMSTISENSILFNLCLRPHPCLCTTYTPRFSLSAANFSPSASQLTHYTSLKPQTQPQTPTSPSTSTRPRTLPHSSANSLAS